jgi:hypothetical protein
MATPPMLYTVQRIANSNRTPSAIIMFLEVRSGPTISSLSLAASHHRIRPTDLAIELVI